MRTALLISALALVACATRVPADLDKLQRDVQNCILSGGHARLGPNDTVVCERD